MAYSGGIRAFYAVIIHDKCKTAGPDVLRAYKTVAEDLLKDQDDPELREALKACDAALKK